MDGNAGNGESAALQAECRRYRFTSSSLLASFGPRSCRRRYEQCIQAHGGIELFLAGIGHDGHIAFNEPGAQLPARAAAAYF